MKTVDFKLGWIKDQPDARDFKSLRHLAAPKKLPSKFVLPSKIPVFDQGNQGSCTANMGCGCFLETRWLDKSPEPLIELSRADLYWNTRVLEGSPTDEDTGATIRGTFKAMNKNGICREQFMPYNDADYSTEPSAEAKQDEPNQKLTKYARVEQTKAAIQATVYAGDSVGFGFYVYESFMKTNWLKKGLMPLPKQNELILGGHAVRIIGWDNRKRAFLVRNSWGEGWAVHGDFWMPYSYALNPDVCDDFWVAEES